MDIAAHIGQLVSQHECVIIPGLGAFLTNYHASEINERQRNIQPPVRILVFNAQLNSNDGLLAHYLSQRLDISYKTSLQVLEVFSSYCQRDLAEGKQIAFGDLGILDKNSHQKLEFYPNTAINYNEDAFGLKPIAIESIERKPDFGLHAPIHKTETKPAIKVIDINRTLRKVAAVLIPIALFISAVLYLPSMVQNKQLYETSVFSFLDSIKSSIFSDDKRDDSVKESKVAESVENPVIENADDNIVLEAVVDNEKMVMLANPMASDVGEQNIVVPTGNYHIICGSFVKKERAEAMIDQLKKDGFQAYVVGQSKSGSFRVSLQSFTNVAEASQQIKKIRHQGYDKAWILHKSF